MTRESLLAWLKEALKWLAEPYAQQIDHLKTLGSWPSTDELALELSDLEPFLAEAVRKGEVPREIELALQRVSEKLDEMSGQQNAHLWTPDALATSCEWETIRLLALEALRKL